MFVIVAGLWIDHQTRAGRIHPCTRAASGFGFVAVMPDGLTKNRPDPKPKYNPATYPLDVVRRRMQTSGMVAIGASVEGALYGSGRAPAAGAGGGSQAHGQAQAQAQQQQPRLPGMVAILKDVHAREGWRGLFKGLSMNWIKVGVLQHRESALLFFFFFKPSLDASGGHTHFFGPTTIYHKHSTGPRGAGNQLHNV